MSCKKNWLPVELLFSPLPIQSYCLNLTLLSGEELFPLNSNSIFSESLQQCVSELSIFGGFCNLSFEDFHVDNFICLYFCKSESTKKINVTYKMR